MPRSPHAPLLRFNVHPTQHSRLFVQVEVFRTVAALRRYSARRPDSDSCACTIFDPKRRTNHLATVRLCLPYLRPSLIAHEMIHAALLYVERRRPGHPLPTPVNRAGVIAIDSAEEILCYAAQWLLAETLIRLEVEGLEPREPEQSLAED